MGHYCRECQRNTTSCICPTTESTVHIPSYDQLAEEMAISQGIEYKLRAALAASQRRVAQLEEAVRKIPDQVREGGTAGGLNYRDEEYFRIAGDHAEDVIEKALATPSAASEVLRAVGKVVAGLDESETHIVANGGDLEDLQAAYRKYEEGK